MGSIFVCVVLFGLLLCWGVFGSVLRCWCRICRCLCLSRPIGWCRSCVFGLCERILGIGMCLVCCECLSCQVVLVLLSSLRGSCVGCIWGGASVGWNACVELWRRAKRILCRAR